MLLKVAEIAKVQYRAHKICPSGLSHMAQLGEIWASTSVQSGHMYVAAECKTFFRTLVHHVTARCQPTSVTHSSVTAKESVT